jgi:hypothetical protein
LTRLRAHRERRGAPAAEYCALRFVPRLGQQPRRAQARAEEPQHRSRFPTGDATGASNYRRFKLPALQTDQKRLAALVPNDFKKLRDDAFEIEGEKVLVVPEPLAAFDQTQVADDAVGSAAHPRNERTTKITPDSHRRRMPSGSAAINAGRQADATGKGVINSNRATATVGRRPAIVPHRTRREASTLVDKYRRKGADACATQLRLGGGDQMSVCGIAACAGWRLAAATSLRNRRMRQVAGVVAAAKL